MDQEYLSLDEVPYGNILLATRTVLEQRLPFFPKGACQYTGRLLSSLRPIITLDEVAGVFQHPEVKGTKNHAWAYDRERKLYIDLTLDQFLENAPKVAILQDSTSLLQRKDSLTAGVNSVPSEIYFTEETLVRLINAIADENDTLLG